MTRLFGFALALLLLGVAVAAVVRPLAGAAPDPLAIEDPATGETVLWPGSAEDPAADAPAEMRVTPCVVDPRTYPILSPENDT